MNTLSTEITDGCRVRVEVYHRGFHQRNFVGKCVGWTTKGLVRAIEDGKSNVKTYSSEHVRKIKS
ncbi:hypothetical protein [Spirosoma sp. 48-14]|uniref:hypothetical protein n=1 Tax=Spirosoma sp. 48-14 TaxID=1895854 RepID=UPI00095E5E6D|nr:hypothetical protein [Spirosoma sp. 48-14]OJW75685.1 MAG: hypothetical protein BGO59_08960 [Spirosoma sp. 48-14]